MRLATGRVAAATLTTVLVLWWGSGCGGSEQPSSLAETVPLAEEIAPSADTAVAGSSEDTQIQDGAEEEQVPRRRASPDTSPAATVPETSAVDGPQGVYLTHASAYRGWDRQARLRRENCTGGVFDPGASCAPATAVPGNSMHNLGLAVDFNIGSTSGYVSPVYAWLQENAEPLNDTVPGEYWHWALPRETFRRVPS